MYQVKDDLKSVHQNRILVNIRILYQTPQPKMVCSD